MTPRRSCEEKRLFILPVGSSSDDRNKIKGPSGALNLNCYNLVDGLLRLNFI